jgi:hypothetical protein
MRKTLNFMTKIIGVSWLLLTFIVVFFLIQGILTPGMKGISTYDLKQYLKITFYLTFVFITLKFILSKLK